MTKDNIKEHIVCINGGSGVIFQPCDKTSSYILTAKHVFKDMHKYNNKAIINRFDPKKLSFISVPEVSIEEGVNYFPHLLKDIAILKIKRLNGECNLSRIDKLDQYKSDISLFGFPDTRRSQKVWEDRLREDLGIYLSIKKSGGKREAVLADNSTWEELVGQSGGGLFSIDSGNLILLGIQNKVPVENEAKGRIEFSPINNFDEITNMSEGKLERIIPAYLKDFSLFIDQIFNIKGSLLSSKVTKFIKEFLVTRSKDVLESDITPIKVKQYLNNELFFLKNQEKSLLQSKNIWIIWFELLTIMNIVNNSPIKDDEFESLLKKIKLFYSDINDDFWNIHLKDLSTANYGDLERDGLVIVASNIPAVGDTHIFDFKDLPEDIYAPMKEDADNRLAIDSSQEFPFEKFRFANISAFKEYIAVDKYKCFIKLSPREKIIKIKKLYEELIKI